jgi:hypothetical protein
VVTRGVVSRGAHLAVDGRESARQDRMSATVAQRATTIRKSAAPPRSNATACSKRATMSEPWLLLSATAVGQHQQSEVRLTDAIGPRRSPEAGLRGGVVRTSGCLRSEASAVSRTKVRLARTEVCRWPSECRVGPAPLDAGPP